MTQNQRNPEYLPFSDSEATKRGNGFRYGSSEYIHHSEITTSESAFSNLNKTQELALSILTICILGSLVINWVLTLTVILFLLAILYALDLLFNMNLIARSLTLSPAIVISDEALARLKTKDLPIYTILCPLYKEAAVLPQFVEAAKKLDYDKKRLQILILLEENDDETLAAAKQMKLPSYFEIVIVPPSRPKTKPKACNYGLKIAKGEYVVIFDAEDIPDPDQLKKAVLAFRSSDESVVCLQSELAFYNPNYNLLTQAFTAEYALWFNLILTGLQSIEAPIPLGGTSNHFKTAILREVGGWDAFNVTEDADLGIRLTKKGYKTSILKSRTMEEANSNLKKLVLAAITLGKRLYANLFSSYAHTTELSKSVPSQAAWADVPTRYWGQSYFNARESDYVATDNRLYNLPCITWSGNKPLLSTGCSLPRGHLADIRKLPLPLLLHAWMYTE